MPRVGAIVGSTAGVAAGVAAAAVAGLALQRRGGQVRAQAVSAEDAVWWDLPVSRRRVVLTSDGVQLYVEEVGPLDAPLTILFVHGFTLNLTSFYFQRKAIAERFGDQVRMVFFDLRSHGRSAQLPSTNELPSTRRLRNEAQSPHRNCTLSQLADDIGSVLDAAQPAGDVALIGHSMGGMCAMELAERHPGYFAPGGPIRAVALLNTSSGDMSLMSLGMPAYLSRVASPFLPSLLRGAARNARVVEGTRAMTRELASLITKRLSFASADVSPELVRFANQMISATRIEVVAAFFGSIVQHAGTDGLRQMQNCSVLVVAGAEDAVVPVSHCWKITAVLPDARLVVVPDTGHLLMLERPDAVNRPLLELLSDVLGKAKVGRS